MRSTVCGGVSWVVPVTEGARRRAVDVGRNIIEAIRKRTEFHKRERREGYEYWREKGWLG
jgi:molybdopterin synthase catalytic subunit